MNAIVTPSTGQRHEPRDTASAPFTSRHIGPRQADAETMLAALGFESLEALVDEAVPADIRQHEPLNLPEARTEAEFDAGLAAVHTLMAKAKWSDASAGSVGLFVPRLSERFDLDVGDRRTCADAGFRRCTGFDGVRRSQMCRIGSHLVTGW